MNQGYFFKALYRICLKSTACPKPGNFRKLRLSRIEGEVKGRTGLAPADQMKGPEGHARVRPEHL